MIPDSLKHNRFVLCRIPRPAELFAKDGTLINPHMGRYSGDVEIPANTPRKTDISLDEDSYMPKSEE